MAIEAASLKAFAIPSSKTSSKTAMRLLSIAN